MYQPLIDDDDNNSNTNNRNKAAASTTAAAVTGAAVVASRAHTNDPSVVVRDSFSDSSGTNVVNASSDVITNDVDLSGDTDVAVVAASATNNQQQPQHDKTFINDVADSGHSKCIPPTPQSVAVIGHRVQIKLSAQSSSGGIGGDQGGGVKCIFPNVGGVVVDVPASCSETVGNVKKKLLSEPYWPAEKWQHALPPRLRMFYSGREMEDELKLQDYKISTEANAAAFIHVVITTRILEKKQSYRQSKKPKRATAANEEARYQSRCSGCRVG
eukprot:Lankesteria_metandrocarpae@DN9_c0_g1_i1.p1